MKQGDVFFSLIICTVGRTTELERLLHSIEQQSFQSFEVLLMDQNADDRISGIIRPFLNKIPIRYQRIPACGISYARNLALSLVSGVFCAFPDDDCFFSVHLLQDVFETIQNLHQPDGLSLLVADVSNRMSTGGIMVKNKIQRITRRNVWHCGNSSGLFLKHSALRDLAGFLESIGVGSSGSLQSGEDTEILLRMIQNGYNLFYSGLIPVFHPQIKWQRDLRRAWQYGCGGGWVLAHYRYPLWFALLSLGWKCILTLKNMLCLRFRSALFHFFMGAGKFFSYIRYRFSHTFHSVISSD